MKRVRITVIFSAILIVILFCVTFQRKNERNNLMPVYTFEQENGTIENQENISVQEDLVPLTPENIDVTEKQDIGLSDRQNDEMELYPLPPNKSISGEYIYNQDQVISILGCTFELMDVHAYRELPDFIQEDEVIVFDNEFFLGSDHRLDPNWIFICITLRITNRMDEEYAYYVSNGNFVRQGSDGLISDSGNEVRYHANAGEPAKTAGYGKDGYRNLIAGNSSVTCTIGYFIHDSMLVQGELYYLIDGSEGNSLSKPEDLRAFLIDLEELD